MLTVKLIGCALILIGCSAVGFSAAKLYRLRVKQLEAFLRLIKHIRAQIEYYRAPLDRIFEGYEDDMLSDCGFLDGARASGAVGGFEACRGRLYLSGGEADELAGFFEGLGRHNADEESAHCAYYERWLDEVLSKAVAELPKRQKLCRAFGLLAGFLSAILLL